MNPHEQLIEEFYAAFAAGEPETMSSCYHPDITFHDPAFGTLKGRDVPDMWRMLIGRSKGQLQIAFSSIHANNEHGSASWTARYPFSKTGRIVTNDVTANFRFKDGLIIEHKDDFDFYAWSRQALGLTGWLLGRTTFLRNKVRNQAISALRRFQSTQK